MKLGKLPPKQRAGALSRAAAGRLSGLGRRSLRGRGHEGDQRAANGVDAGGQS